MTNNNEQYNFINKTNITNSDLGTKVIFASDEFFASANRMLAPNQAVFIDDKFDDNGKWMDGWETRRRRDGKNDFCFIKLAQKSSIKGFDVDTSHFSGNYTPAVSIMGCCATSNTSDDEIINNEQNFKWLELLSAKDLQGDNNNLFVAQNNEPITHLKVTMYPDGGIARLRAYGDICFNDDLYQQDNTNLISIFSGARAIYANNEHFGKLENILAEHIPLTMADGWETRRRREPGNDWGIIALTKPAIVNNIIVDTKFFKGNYPDTFSICSANLEQATDKSIINQSMFWEELIPQQKLSMDKAHNFPKEQLLHQKPITHIRLNIFPDGGIARLKLMGSFIK